MPHTGHLFLKYIIPQRLPQGQGCGMLNVQAVLLKIIMILSNPTHHPRRRGLRLLEAISYGYTFSFTPSLLLSAKKRRYALDFSRERLREKAGCTAGNLSLRAIPQDGVAIRTPSETQRGKIED